MEQLVKSPFMISKLDTYMFIIRWQQMEQQPKWSLIISKKDCTKGLMITKNS